MVKILFVCHGNICRSTMAQYVMQHLVDIAGLHDRFFIDSAATSTEEIGNGVHWGTRQKLQQVGVRCGSHRARQLTRGDYTAFDHIIGMDEANRRNMLRMLGGDPDGKVSLLLDGTAHPRPIADPWYTGDFNTTYDDVLEGCTALLARLR